MIQRIQSLYLLLGVAFLASTFVFSLAHFEYPDNTISMMTAWGLTGSGVEPAPSTAGFPYIVITSAILFIASLLLFRNRLLQIRLVRFNFLVMAVAIALLSVYLGNCADAKDGKVIFGIGFFVILPAMLFNWMAARAIRKDEELIKSVDRIR